MENNKCSKPPTRTYPHSTQQKPHAKKTKQSRNPETANIGKHRTWISHSTMLAIAENFAPCQLQELGEVAAEASPGPTLLGFLWMFMDAKYGITLWYTNIAIEHGHRNR